MSHDPHNRYLLELLDTLLKAIERQTRRIEQAEHEDLETLRLILRELRRIADDLNPPPPPPPPLNLATNVSFQEISMNPTEAGQTQVFTGTLAPAGSVLASDAVATISSNDPAVSPTLDSTNLIVSVDLSGMDGSRARPLRWLSHTRLRARAPARRCRRRSLRARRLRLLRFWRHRSRSHRPHSSPRSKERLLDSSGAFSMLTTTSNRGKITQ